MHLQVYHLPFILAVSRVQPDQLYICECARAHYIKPKNKKQLSFKIIASNVELLNFGFGSNRGS